MRNSEANEKRHRALCTVCNHGECDEIERLWRSGRSANSLQKEYGVGHRGIIQHMRFFGIKLDLECALEAILSSGVDELGAKGATPAHANEAAKSLAKLRGLWVDRTELLPPGFAGRSEAELEFYGAKGRWPREGEVEGEAVH